MDRHEKIYCLYRTLKSSRFPVSLQHIREELDCTERNAKNIILALRNMGAPLEYDRERNGYYFDTRHGDTFELPGLWFNAAELHALMASQQLLAEVQPGWLDSYIQPIRDRIEKLLADKARDYTELRRRVKVLQVAARPAPVAAFQAVGEALVTRRRLYIVYRSRGKDELSDRDVSPQRLVYYRHNWLLDAWCHKQNALRSFAIDRMHPARILEETAVDIADAVLDEHYAAAYGIFAGKAEHIAHLRFSATAARWVADERWHPEERWELLSDGRYELKIPYGNPTELIMDILRYGPDVEVLGPPDLRNTVAERAGATARLYVAR